MPITSIEPRRLYRQVADQLRQLIDSGEFAIGTRLPGERELALQLGVSRPTVREALIALEVDGRVRIRVGSGIYVLAAPEQPAPDSLPVAGPFDILKARGLFEGAVAEEAARIATADDVAGLDTILDAMKGADHPGPSTVELDRAFHVALADILRNDAVTKVVGDLFDQRINPYFAQLARHFENAESWRTALAEHRAIRDRLAAGDAAGARKAMTEHLERSQERFSTTFGTEAPAEAPRIVPRRPATSRLAAAAK